MRAPWHSAACSALCWLSLIVSATALWAADAKPQKASRVTVSKNDGTTVAGELVGSSPEGLTVKVSTAAEPVIVPWADIKRASNGLTRQKVLDEWKLAHPERLCEACRGEGLQKCDHCAGTGVDPATATECATCHGSGDVGKCPRCKEGKVPCPNTCLKADAFPAKSEPDGTRRKVYHIKGGTIWISDHHIGDLVVMENGIPTLKGKCPTCHGTAKKECPTCHGGGKVGPACPECKAGKIVCKTCDGTGLKPA